MSAPGFSDSLFCSCSSDQQPMAIHRNGNTGHKGHIVLSVYNGQVVGVRRQHLLDLIHGVGEGFVVDVEIEHISVFQLWKVGEQPCIAHAAVSCQHAMGAFAANGQGCFGQMSNAFTEHTGGYTVVDRQQDIDLWNLDVAHDPFGGEIQQCWVLVILCELCFKGISQRHGFRQVVIVVLGTFQLPLGFFIVQPVHGAGVVRNNLGLVEIVEPLAYFGIGQQGASSEKDAPCQYQRDDSLTHGGVCGDRTP